MKHTVEVSVWMTASYRVWWWGCHSEELVRHFFFFFFFYLITACKEIRQCKHYLLKSWIIRIVESSGFHWQVPVEWAPIMVATVLMHSLIRSPAFCEPPGLSAWHTCVIHLMRTATCPWSAWPVLWIWGVRVGALFCESHCCTNQMPFTLTVHGKVSLILWCKTMIHKPNVCIKSWEFSLILYCRTFLYNYTE